MVDEIYHTGPRAGTSNHIFQVERLLEELQRDRDGAKRKVATIARYNRPEQRRRCRISDATAFRSKIALRGLAAILAMGVLPTYLTASFDSQPVPHRAPVALATTLTPTPVGISTKMGVSKHAPMAALAQAATPASARGAKAIPQSRTAQVSEPAVKLPEFEVASIKLTNLNGQIKVGVEIYPGGRVVISGYELEGLIGLAFRPWKISGGADWTKASKYDLVAVPPKAMQASIKDLRGVPDIADPHLRQMLQALLVSRFELRFHRETKTGTVYLLEKSGKPPAFHPASADPSIRPPGRRPIFRRGGQWVLNAATMPELAGRLSDVLASPVLDETGLSGAYDYRQRSTDLDSANREDLNTSFLSFFKELHLKLQKSKGPIETFVIDGSKRPSPD